MKEQGDADEGKEHDERRAEDGRPEEHEEKRHLEVLLGGRPGQDAGLPAHRDEIPALLVEIEPAWGLAAAFALRSRLRGLSISLRASSSVASSK